jgi:ribosomal protein L11 methyltransferase
MTLPRKCEDEVIGLLDLNGCEGTSTRPAGAGRVAVEAWFGDEAGARRASAVLRATPGIRLRTATPDLVEDPGWLAAATAPRAPIEVGPFVVLDERLARRSALARRIPLVIPPGRAFGTGEHATTRLCLRLLARFLVPGDAVLDLGTGSGILAIAAARAGGASVLALDNDERVIDVARENVRVNRVASRVSVAPGSWAALPPRRKFELILANIHRTALVRGARRLTSRLAMGGRAILSGFGPEDMPAVAAAWKQAGAIPAGRLTDGAWAALVVRRSPN